MPTKYRADHIGSFLRPPELLEAKRAGSSQRVRKLEDSHITRVLAKQKELGFEIFTDGELRRYNFMSDFTDAVEGFDMGDAVAVRSLSAIQTDTLLPVRATYIPVRMIRGTIDQAAAGDRSHGEYTRVFRDRTAGEGKEKNQKNMTWVHEVAQGS